MPTASLCLAPAVDPAVIETLVQLRTIAVRLIVLAANSAGFAAVMWLLLATPGFIR